MTFITCWRKNWGFRRACCDGANRSCGNGFRRLISARGPSACAVPTASLSSWMRWLNFTQAFDLDIFAIDQSIRPECPKFDGAAQSLWRNQSVPNLWKTHRASPVEQQGWPLHCHSVIELTEVVIAP